MKNLFLFYTLISSSLGFAQFGLEHTYYDGVITRVLLENSGEKYYLFNKQASRFEFFNSDYSLWKTVAITVPANTYGVVIGHVSETAINPDSQIEISYSANSYPGVPQSKIINETGAILLSVDNCASLKVDMQPGFETKIISANHTVYSVPGLLPEHTYSGNELERIKLEISGEKYYAVDAANSLVNLYNSDHSFWKSILLPKPDGYTISNISLLSENQLNEDSLIEVGYGSAGTQGSEARIINENGDPLLTVTDAAAFRVSHIEGLPDKLFVDSSAYIDGVQSQSTAVYAIPGLNLEHVYQNRMLRTKLNYSGEKYYPEACNPGSAEIVIYNDDHTPWQTFGVSSENPAETYSGIYLSDTEIDPDSQVELVYTINSNTLDGGHYLTNLVKEDGTVSLSISEAYSAYVSKLPGAQTKLIANVKSGPFDNASYFSSVYGPDGTFAVRNFNGQTATIFPSPTRNMIHINSEKLIVKADLFDARGLSVQEVSGADIKTLNVENLQNGIYFLQLLDTAGNHSSAKIVVAH